VDPLDDALDLVAGYQQLDLQHAAAQLGTEVPYDTAHALFGTLTGMPFGSERMHTGTNQVAENLTVVDVDVRNQPSLEDCLAIRLCIELTNRIEIRTFQPQPCELGQPREDFETLVSRHLTTWRRP
jgi:hypothetical protein